MFELVVGCILSGNAADRHILLNAALFRLSLLIVNVHGLSEPRSLCVVEAAEGRSDGGRNHMTDNPGRNPAIPTITTPCTATDFGAGFDQGGFVSAVKGLYWCGSIPHVSCISMTGHTNAQALHGAF